VPERLRHGTIQKEACQILQMVNTGAEEEFSFQPIPYTHEDKVGCNRGSNVATAHISPSPLTHTHSLEETEKSGKENRENELRLRAAQRSHLIPAMTGPADHQVSSCNR